MKSKFFVLKLNAQDETGNIIKVNTNRNSTQKIKDMDKEYYFSLIETSKRGYLYNLYRETQINTNPNQGELFFQDKISELTEDKIKPPFTSEEIENREQPNKLEYIGRIFLDLNGNLISSPIHSIKKIYLNPISLDGIYKNNISRLVTKTINNYSLN